jgi:hypothetical protein
MKLRWFNRDDGTRVLQVDTMFGWQDVSEAFESEERNRDAAAREEAAYEEVRRRYEEWQKSLPPYHRRLIKDFTPV